MSAIKMQAYRTAQKATIVSEREIDAYALTQCALKLRECQQKWSLSEKERIDRLFAALKINSKLWSIFQAEITREDNPLPKQVRQDLLTLSLFVDKRTKDIMCFPEPEKLEILININLNLAAGLSVKSVPLEQGKSALP
ncbi:MAG: flagellar biosynthesis regulator FlaF [Syntrophorhabdus aromaticivorans]|uniref:Flagellar biosynthesis regulator FlaF n=1 Tax=Syntrophorhabdus aromaticivorans TaxID=328301 RepID=A0A971M5W8_9BACT|nr:flagellar biosynthesis regulator FlaF [Syntrophorhabdus aromaticivorans]